ncbi:hypothetical protein FIU93_08030 [Labrenzia sp. THAF35]|uniref:hypothetical protein n=1 Tax=Labrenzia sp. THAF35 TaxID=2587854 RepID=UPI0012A9627F|nr:hypothetical protein [Labrenzia sp. THAF35]QFT66723.1 hypothetical protein FIU93_08030 [Labrenzia sp. THAF35]
MTRILFDALANFAAVFGGLFILWSVLRVMTPGQRLGYAAMAGCFSAVATFIVTAAAAA